ncbi:MAG: hypothetical protein E7232_10165 [Lachnospiraceae bacterium]|nr:hypothetical protein [Lachnospiraceae bacterium]
MKISRRLLCLIMTVIFSLAQIPMTAFALDKYVNKEYKTNSSDFKFDVRELTLENNSGEYSLDRYLVNGVGAEFVVYSCEDGAGVIEVDEGGAMKVVGEGSATVVATAENSTSYEGYVNASTSEICKASASNAVPATIYEEQPYKATMKVTVKSEQKSSGSSSGGSSGGGGGGGGGGSSSGFGAAAANGGTFLSPSGATVTTNTAYLGNGVRIITASITLSGKTLTAEDKITPLKNGSLQRMYTVVGDMSGLAFMGAGIVSEDGRTLTAPDGTVYPVTNAIMCIITDVNGATIGCFLDPETGNPLTFDGAPAVMQLGIDGQMHAHYINPQGYFYTGTVEMNGGTFAFNEEGVMISYI